MLSTFEEMDYSRLRSVIRRVRRRWRMRVLLKGTAMVALLGFTTLAILSYGLDYLRYRPWALTSFSVIIYAVLLLLLLRFFVLPLSRRVADDRVALYIEEHEPELQAEILSAVQFSRQSDSQDTPDRSAAFTRELIASAVMHCQNLQYGRAIERGTLRRFATALAAVAALLIVAALLSPAFLRAGASLLLMPWTSTAFASPYAIDVLPGNVEVARGADQLVSALLVGFDSDRVEISFRSEGADWERWPMSNEESAGEFQFMLFDLDERTEYFVEASGVRSPMYRVDVTDLPYVDRIDLEYRFPAYSGLEVQTVEDGGDIAVLRGTEVRLRAYSTVEVPGGRIVLQLDDPADPALQDSGGAEVSDSIELTVGDDGSYEGGFTVNREGTYQIELQGFNGVMSTASPVYFIEVLSDQPPRISFDTPGRDISASSIDEVFVELSAEDDYGLSALELTYSVNGGPRQTLPLYRAATAEGSPQVDELTASHTFYLEEENLEPGDFISYFARAYDRRDGNSQVATTDIYFIQARPFDREFRQGQQAGRPPAGQSGQQQQQGALAQRQKEIVLATFKLIRDRDLMSHEELDSDLATIAMLQDRLRQQVELLLGRTSQRGSLQPGSEFQQMAEYMRSAIEAMLPAHESLIAQDPDGALPHEQRALQFLQRAEALMREVEVNFSGGGQGGGGQQESVNENLADLLDLEMEKLRNQYETVQRGQQQQLDNQVDEALQRLEELARRQQQENERSRRLANMPQNMSGSGGASQRQLADEAEELARRLERLSRENSDPELAETARRLREAANAMRRSAASADENAVSEGVAALRDIERARNQLDQNRTRRLQRDMEDALDKIAQMRQEQEKIAADVEQMGDSRGTAERQRLADQMDRVLERKDELSARTAALEDQIEQMARDSRREQKETSRKLQETSAWMRDSKLADKIRYSKGVAQQRLGGYAEQFEEQIGNDLEQLEGMLEEAAAAISDSDRDRMASSLQQTRDVVRRLESLEERMQQDQRGQDGQSDQQRQEDQQGQGQEGQQGQQGQGNQQGQASQGGQQRGLSGNPQTDQGTRMGGPSGPRGISPENLRQYEREYQQRLADVEELRDRLAEDNQQVTDLDEILEAMRDLEFDGTPRGIEELRGQIIEELKMFEYYLRRLADADSGRRPTLADSDEVPESYRQMVEEYFRALARSGDSGGQQR
jgi:hypothetical protein